MAPTTDTNRRQVLRSLDIAAVGSAGLVAGSAGAEDCFYEYKCREVICPFEEPGGLTELRRECCETSGDTTCSDWQASGCC